MYKHIPEELKELIDSMFPEDQAFISVQDFAKFINVSPTSVCRLIAEKKLKAIKINPQKKFSEYRIPKWAIVEFFANNFCDTPHA